MKLNLQLLVWRWKYSGDWLINHLGKKRFGAVEVQLRAYSTERRRLNSTNFRSLYFPEKSAYNIHRLGCLVGPRTVRIPWLERIPGRLFFSIVASNFFNIIPQFTSLGICWEMVSRGMDLSGSQQAPVSIYRLLIYIPVRSTYVLRNTLRG